MQKATTYFIFFSLLQNLFPSKAKGQPWYLTRGGQLDDEAWGVDADSIGNIYWATGEKISSGNRDIKLYKIDSNAQEIWQSAPWGLTYLDIAFKVTVKGQNVYIGGRIDSASATLQLEKCDALILSYNMNNGGLNWPYVYNPNPDYGYEEIDGLIVQPDGIYFSGWAQGQNTNDMNFLIQKISLAGSLVWSNIYDYNFLGKFDGANGHMAMDNNFLYVAGSVNRTNILSFDGDGALVCFSRSNGAYQWHVTWGGAFYDDALGMTMSADSMLHVVGYTGSFGNSSQIYLKKYTRTGQLKWSRLWGGTGGEVSRSIVMDGDSIIYVTGTTSSYGNGGDDIVILKYDTAGTLLDSVFWGGTYDEVAHDVTMFGDYLYITGITKSYGNGQITGDHKSDGLLLKVNGRTMQPPDSTMTNISETQILEEIFFVCPNPTKGDLQITIYEERLKHAELKIFDVLGQEVYKFGITNPQSEIQLNLLNGIYFLKITTQNSVQTQKLVKQ